MVLRARWPHTQLYLDRPLGYFDPATIEKVTWRTVEEVLGPAGGDDLGVRDAAI